MVLTTCALPEACGASSTTSGRCTLWTTLALVSIVALAAWVRLHDIGVRSLWYDEAISVSTVKLPWLDSLETAWERGAGNMLFYLLLLRAWAWFGLTEPAVRGLSVLFGVLTIPLLFLLGARLFNRGTGLLAALLLSLHSLHVAYSQEARSYALLVLLLVLSTAVFAGAAEAPERTWRWCVYVLLCTLACYSQMLALLVIMAQWCALSPAYWRRIGIVRVASVWTSLLIFCLPIAHAVFIFGPGTISWISPPTLLSVRSTIGQVLGSGFSGRDHAVPILYAVACLPASMLLLIRGMDSRESFRLRLVLFWVFIPVVLALLISLRSPLFINRYLLMIVPGVTLLAGHAIDASQRIWGGERARPATAVSAGLLLALVAFSVVGVVHYYADIATRPDYRGAIAWLLDRRLSHDGVILQRFSYYPFEYYRTLRSMATGVPEDIRIVYNPEPALLSGDRAAPIIASRSAGEQRFWALLDDPELPLAKLQSDLSHNFVVGDRREFTGGITVALFEKTVQPGTR